MKYYLQLFWTICLFRQGPNDVPYSKPLFAGLLGLNYILISVGLSNRLMFEQIIWKAALLLLTYLVIVTLLLAIRRMRSRFMQTANALLGTGALLSCLILALVMGIVFLQELMGSSQFFVTVAYAASLFIFVLYLWSIAVVAHILRVSLSIHLIWALLLALAIEASNMVLFSFLT